MRAALNAIGVPMEALAIDDDDLATLKKIAA